MERFWRTLREGCLDHLGSVASLHDVNVRLWAFLDAHYHKALHASLLGRSPEQVFQAGRGGSPDCLDEAKLREALTTRVKKRVRKDTTVTAKVYELDQGYLAGRLVTLCRCLVDLGETPWIEVEGRRFELRPVDAVRNSHRQRLPKKHPASSSGQHQPFDPAGALLDLATGKSPRRGDR
jgi:hypothetical protein